MKFKSLVYSGIAVSIFAIPVAVLTASAALGHHSFAMFDNSRTVQLEGTVRELEWINPHVWLHINAPDESGTMQEWSFEAGSTGQLGQTNWTPNSVVPGETITVGFHPLKDGSNGGQLLDVTKADGVYLCQGGDCRDRLQELEQQGQAAAPEAAPQEANASEQKPIPDFVGYWQRRGEFPSTWEVPEDPALRPGPLVNTITGANAGLLWVADHTNPILMPWNAEYLRERGESELIEVNTVAHNICWPSGVPQVANMREPVQFLQEEDQVTLIYQRDHQVRYVHLNQKHPENVEPSWYGHSIGHYEGDTLVVDTIGLRDGTGVDRFNTQHTEKLHVVERYRLIEDGTALRVNFVVEDPGAFTQPWYGQATYGEAHGPINEVVCAENNRDITAGVDAEYPIPHFDGTPAF